MYLDDKQLDSGALARRLLAVGIATDAQAKVGPVCAVKQAKKSPKKCVVIKTPNAQPDQTIVIDLGGK